MKYNTRIAPSPTGMMHIGTARTALFNWVVAKSSGGHFILRLDDTDTERNQPEAIQPIFDGLKWLGIEYDGYYRQSERAHIYQQYANNLLDSGLAFTADNGAIMLKWHDFMPRSWEDSVGGKIVVSNKAVEEIDGRLCLIRGGEKLGQATYQFASIVDDYDLGINYIIRGVDHIANTAKQVAIWSALVEADQKTIDLPKFTHVGLIFKDGKKMSKRDGAASLLDYKDKGYSPDAIFNFLIRTGWGPKVDDKQSTFIDKDRAFELFLTQGNMRSSNAGFDQNKLDFYNRKYKAIHERNV